MAMRNQGNFIMNATPLGNQATQSHYVETELTSPCPILLMLSSRLGSDKDQFDKAFG